MVIKGTLRLMGPRGNDPVVQRLVCLSLVFTVALYFIKFLVLYVMSSHRPATLDSFVQ
jgi:hypothetical protein